jgi:hypothetical protein
MWRTAPVVEFLHHILTALAENLSSYNLHGAVKANMNYDANCNQNEHSFSSIWRSKRRKQPERYTSSNL